MIYLLAILLTVLNIFDFYSTYKILRAGGNELNPIMNFLIQKLGLVWALAISKLIVLVCISILVWFKMVYLLIVLICLYTYIAVHNFREMKKIKI